MRLRKRDFRELAYAYVVANTPESLARGLVKSDAVTRMKEQNTRADIAALYDRVTARANSEIAVGLGYALLVAWTLAERREPSAPLDAGRLRWGEAVAEAAKLLSPPVETVIIEIARSQPKVQSINAPGALILPHGAPP